MPASCFPEASLPSDESEASVVAGTHAARGGGDVAEGALRRQSFAPRVGRRIASSHLGVDRHVVDARHGIWAELVSASRTE